MRITGRVKWFDPVKGYGFVVSDDGEVALLHRSVLEAAGFHTTPDEGTEVVYDTRSKRQGVQVSRVHSVSASNAEPSPNTPPPPTQREVLSDNEDALAMSGEVKWYSRPKGYGFIAASRGEVFVHMDTLRKSGIDGIEIGQRVIFEAMTGPKGLTATRIIHVTGKGQKPKSRAPELDAPLALGELTEGLVGELLWIDEEKRFGAISVAGIEGVAIADLDLLRDVGALDPKTCGNLVCDLEYTPPLILVVRIRRFH